MASQPRSSMADNLRELWSGFLVQRRVVGALMLRELHTRYGRENIGYAWMLGEPLLLATAIATIHELGGGKAHEEGIHPAAFGSVGYIMFMLIRQVFNRAEGAIHSNAPLLHHRQVTLTDICVARSLLELVGVVLTFIVVISAAILLGWMGPPARPEWLALGATLLFFFVLGFGMMLCALVAVSPIADRLLHPFTYLLIPLSGAFYALAWLSPSWRRAASWLPLPHYFEIIRYGVFETAHWEYFSLTYALWSAMIAMLVGLCSLKAVRHHLHTN